MIYMTYLLLKGGVVQIKGGLFLLVKKTKFIQMRFSISHRHRQSQCSKQIVYFHFSIDECVWREQIVLCHTFAGKLRAYVMFLQSP